MRLMDQICQATGPILVQNNDDGGVFELPGCSALASSVALCPLRFVLDDIVAETCTRLGFCDDTLVGRAVDILRCPAPSLWIEFRAAARNNVYAETDRLADAVLQFPMQRIGLLVQSDRSGRRGTIHSCWENREPHAPHVAPFFAEFDFDRPADSVSRSRGDASNAAHLEVRVDDFPALEGLFRHLRFCFQPEWLSYYRNRCKSQQEFQRTVEAAVKPLAEDIPFFAAFVLLLMAGNATRKIPVELSALNKARRKRGKAPLMDHVELRLELGGADDIGAASYASSRSAARFHFVRGHLVRRGSAVFWRVAHMRGQKSLGIIARRTVSLGIAAE